MASKRHVRRKACEGKQRHATREAAFKHATALFKGKGDRVSVYRCRFCGGGWHVGHFRRRDK